MTTANGTATTWGQTITLDDLRQLERELAAMPKPLWTLIGPDGRAWQSTEPRELLAVLAGACYPLSPAGVPACLCGQPISDECKASGCRWDKEKKHG